jgi:hypothetical protein
MTIKKTGGVFGRNPTFNDVTIEGELTFDGELDINSDINLPDNKKITFGDSDNLEIFHDASNSIIKDAGSGNLYIQGNHIYIKDPDGNNFARFFDNGVGGQIRLYHDASKVFETNASGISIAGNVAVTSGNGIDFSATAGTGTSELLDDYEEGVWTPVIADSSSGGNTGTSLTAQGEYTKVGNVVYAKCTLVNVDTTGLTSATTAFIQGLPFASLNTTAASHDLGSCVLSRTTFTGFVTCGVPDNASSVRFMESATGVSYDYLDVSEFTSTLADIYFSVVYLAA